MLAQQPNEVMLRMKDLIPAPLLQNPKLASLTARLEHEVDADYEFSLRKAIGKNEASMFCAWCFDENMIQHIIVCNANYDKILLIMANCDQSWYLS